MGILILVLRICNSKTV